MADTNQNVEIHIGDSKRICLTIYDEDDNLLDITDYTLYYYVYESSGNPLITKSSGDGITIVNAGNGSCTVDFEPSDTENMSGDYKHEVDITDGTDVYTVMTGKLTVLDSVATEVGA
jgi:hypothetical protein